MEFDFCGREPVAQPPLSAGAVPELPVVATIRHFVYSGIARNGFSQEAVLVDFAPEMPDSCALTPHAPAQATIDALRADLKEVCELGLWRKSEMERLTKELAAIKAKQVAEVDEVMRLVGTYADRFHRFALRPTTEDNYDMNAAREALRAALTKDRT